MWGPAVSTLSRASKEVVRPVQLPERIKGLQAIATNLSWSWDADARALFRRIDNTLWYLTRHNPISLLQRTPVERLAVCAEDPEFLAHYDRVLAGLERLSSNAGTWFGTAYGDLAAGPIAYFCAEFGLHNSVPIYSGGLGILAGDHCKSASDLGVPLVGVGLFYTRGYFDQRLRIDGWQEDADETFDPATTPLAPVRGPAGELYLTTVQASGRTVHVGAWKATVGRIPVYLLDTDLEENDPADRQVLRQLYAGGPELRLRQEWILGVGGVRVLRTLGIQPAGWHANEGHAAFMFLERLRELTRQGVSLNEAVRRVRATSLFTTHTPVPAGHDVFSHEQVERCAGRLWEEMGVRRSDLLALGRNPAAAERTFHMTAAAIRLSGRVNGVAARHGEETRRIWGDLWPRREPSRLPIVHVTNGVHLGTWMAQPLKDFLDRSLGAGWSRMADDQQPWDRVLSLDSAALWEVHLRLKAFLLNFIREEARDRWAAYWREPAHVVGAGTLLSSGALTIGFARRFATYKRADLIFRDRDRLRRLLVNRRQPVQIIFAGKAHPADEPGKKILQEIHAFTRDPSFEGRIAFLEDYEMHLAHRLVQGVDLWLNLPRPPLEACGTSGMKAGLNAVPQLSTADGWWAEAYNGMNGWLIPPAPAGVDPDAFDAEQFYRLLETEVVPLFYDRGERRVPVAWVERMKQALRVTGERFTANRMVREYARGCYLPWLRGEPFNDDPPVA
ncbi:MAG: alpha-glucan family phosphorylase [Gemmatimonadetes bacterium]|nr:alpha-glucan family phosphorylase [Gemmatimonadota bacterium]